VPTFADYVPVVSAAVTDGTRRAYGSYRNKVVEQWGSRRLDEPSPSQIRELMMHVKTHVVARRNARGGRSAQEHLVAALRCLYQRAVDDGLIAEADNPARKVAKPRRLPSTRRAVPDTRLAQISTRSPRPPAMIRSWTRRCCGCTPRPPAAAAARSPSARRTWTPSSA
jgi:integrase/recombinase XerC